MRLTPAAGLLWAVVFGVIVFAYVTADRGGASGTETATAAPTTTDTTTTSEPVAPLVLPDPLPTRVVDLPILLYHRIDVIDGDDPPAVRRLTVEPQEFQLQMRWLEDQGYETITQGDLFAALMDGSELPERAVLLLFQGGYRTTLTKAAPIMAALGQRGTASIPTGSVPATKRENPSLLTWTQIRILQQRGFEIGSQTVADRPLIDLDDARATAQLRRSRLMLEERLDQPVQWLTYPDSAVDARVERLALDAGYVLAAAVAPGTRQSARSPLRLSAFRVTETTGVRGLATALGS